jgi:hypothetical protein
LAVVALGAVGAAARAPHRCGARGGHRRRARRLGLARFGFPAGDPAHVHAICEEYRAAATLDAAQDAADRAGGKRIACPVLALWGKGLLDEWYADAGGPLGLWRQWADEVQGEALAAGHFFPEEMPGETAARLERFLAPA